MKIFLRVIGIVFSAAMLFIGTLFVCARLTYHFSVVGNYHLTSITVGESEMSQDSIGSSEFDAAFDSIKLELKRDKTFSMNYFSSQIDGDYSKSGGKITLNATTVNAEGVTMNAEGVFSKGKLTLVVFESDVPRDVSLEMVCVFEKNRRGRQE